MFRLIIKNTLKKTIKLKISNKSFALILLYLEKQLQKNLPVCLSIFANNPIYVF